MNTTDTTTATTDTRPPLALALCPLLIESPFAGLDDLDSPRPTDAPSLTAMRLTRVWQILDGSRRPDLGNHHLFSDPPRPSLLYYVVTLAALALIIATVAAILITTATL